jgi:hypothetical protein
MGWDVGSQQGLGGAHSLIDPGAQDLLSGRWRRVLCGGTANRAQVPVGQSQQMSIWCGVLLLCSCMLLAFAEWSKHVTGL